MIVGGWKRSGPVHCIGEARSENTGSVSQNPPRSLSRMVEWPSRNRLRFGAASSCSRVILSTGIGFDGRVSSDLLKAKSQVRRKVFHTPRFVTGLTLRTCWLPPGAGDSALAIREITKTSVTTKIGTPVIVIARSGR